MTISASQLNECIAMRTIGLTPAIIAAGINYVHDVLGNLDTTLTSSGEERLGALVELANLSSIIGNFFRTGIARASQGKFEANGPHKYPDIIARDPSCLDVEIKVALEDNKPKGHLVKPGPHIIVRYVLCTDDGSFARGKENRGAMVRIWEVRVGMLENGHFNESNTPGDSGKTAVINAEGMEALTPVFMDKNRCPWSPRGARYRQAFQA